MAARTVDGRVVDRAVDACAANGIASDGGASGACQMVHAATGPLALTQLCGFRFRRIQRARIDVRRPHCRRNQKPTHYHYQTKTAPSQLGHLAFVPRFPGFNGRSYFRMLHEACQPNTRPVT